MSNKDTNGFERVWQLQTEVYTGGTPQIKSRSRIIPNPDCPDAKEISSAFAFASCAADAILYRDTPATNALEKHLTDLHKWP